MRLIVGLCWACTCHAAFTPAALHHQARSLRRHGRLLAVTDQPSRNSSSDAAADSAAGIGTRLADLNSLLGRFRDNSVLDLLRDKLAFLPPLLDQVASAARIDVAYLVVAVGTVLYVYLNRAAKDLTIFQFDSPEADVVAARVLAVAAFVLLQQAAGLDPRSWLRLGGEPAAAADAGGPLGSVFALPTPVAGVAFALLFVLPVAALSAAGVRLLPVYGRAAWSKCPCLPAAARVATCCSRSRRLLRATLCPRGGPSPHGCRREAASVPWRLPKWHPGTLARSHRPLAIQAQDSPARCARCPRWLSRVRLRVSPSPDPGPNPTPNPDPN